MNGEPRTFEQLTRDYQWAFRQWHEARYELSSWHGEQFFPIGDRDLSLLNDAVLEEHHSLRLAEQQAYERLLAVRAALKALLGERSSE